MLLNQEIQLNIATTLTHQLHSVEKEENKFLITTYSLRVKYVSYGCGLTLF